MISQLDFDPGDYHLRVMIERMERDGRSEHAIEDAVRTASVSSPVAEPRTTKNRGPAGGGRGFTRWSHRVRPSGFERRTP
jgi:hypothetical protein